MGIKRVNVGACEGEEGSGLGHRRRKALLLMPDCSHMGDGFAPFLYVSLSLFFAMNVRGRKVQRLGLSENLWTPSPFFRHVLFQPWKSVWTFWTCQTHFIQTAVPSWSPPPALVYLFSFSLTMFVSLFLLPLLLFCIFQKELRKRSLVLAPCLIFILALFLACSVRSFFPSLSFHPPVCPPPPPPSLSLISSRCVSCIPLVRAEGEGSLKRRRRGEKHGGRGVRASGREMH